MFFSFQETLIKTKDKRRLDSLSTNMAQAQTDQKKAP